MKHRRIEILILLFTVLLIGVVATVGSLTFTNLKAIEKQSEKIYQPNRTLIQLKLLLSELRSSENCIRSYSLYNSEEYLHEYQISLAKIDQCFDSLYFYQKNNVSAKESLDSTRILVEQKILVLNRQLTLRNEDKVIGELKKIKIKLDKVSHPPLKITSTSTTLAKPEAKKGLLSRLFKRKKAVNAKSGDSINVVINKSSIESVKKEVNKVEQSQTRMFSLMKSQELELINEDKIIWNKLVTILNRLENSQNAALRAIATENLKQTEKMHKLTLLFGVSILVMLFFLAVFSIYYFYSQRKHRAELNKAVLESRMLAKARETFLANMSHEMRTPLNAIIGFTEQLGITHLDAEQEKELNIINSASKHLLSLVNDVLDLSKIEAEKLTFESIAFNPQEQLKEAFEFFKPKIADKNLSTSLFFENDLPVSLLGDPLRLKQVIINLLSNSVKFTSEGGINILVSSQNKSEEIKFLCVSVEDTGIGIEANMIDKVFENFQQADSSIIRKYGGTGLGLSITKKIIELQGGDIKVESEIGKGTKITFRIPYKINTEEVKTVVAEDKFLPTIARGKKVLIADDEAFNRALLITILKRWDITYDEAENGKQALDLAIKNDYDIILMDLRMPEVSGIDATLEIRKLRDKSKASVPIIALTAAVSDEKRKVCMDAGMNDVLTKPYKEAKLLRLIEQTISNIKANEKV